MRVIFALVSAVLFLPAAPVVGQSSETDEKKPETKTYTAYDLRRAGGARRTAPPSVPANPSAATTSDQASADASGDTEQEDAAAAEEAWRKKLLDAEAVVTKLNQQIVSIERTLGDVSRDLYGKARRVLTSDLALRREELVDAEAAVEELVQEGYGSGYVR